MKILVAGLLIFALHPAMAASTDTVQVEQKVVELHMTKMQPIMAEESNKRNRKTKDFAGHATCSGSFIDDSGNVLTARHCVEGFDSIDVVTFDGQEYRARVVAKSELEDLAIIHIGRTNSPYFKRAQTVTRGEKIFLLGSPLAITDVLSTGIVAKLSGDRTLIDCSALAGNSGGPVFDEDGNLVGVLTAGFVVMLGTTHLNVAQSLDSVKSFIYEVFVEKNYGR